MIGGEDGEQSRFVITNADLRKTLFVEQSSCLTIKADSSEKSENECITIMNAEKLELYARNMKKSYSSTF